MNFQLTVLLYQLYQKMVSIASIAQPKIVESLCLAITQNALFVNKDSFKIQVIANTAQPLSVFQVNVLNVG